MSHRYYEYLKVYRGRNGIVYHCRQHIGDYPYRCVECGFAEVSKAALNEHLITSRHNKGTIIAKNCQRDISDIRPGMTHHYDSSQYESYNV